MRDRIGHLTGFMLCGRLLDAHLDKLGRAFTIAHDRLRKFARNIGQRLGKRGKGRCAADSIRIGPRPVAIVTKESLVEVSPSIVMQLNDRSATCCVSCCSNGAAIAASVAMKPSIVAMFGRIIPAPFAIPVNVTVVPAMLARRDTAFGTVSVVIMACAACNQ